MAFHSEQTKIHVIHNYTFEDAADRTSATGFNILDVGKVAHQLDDNTFYILTATIPTWQEITGGIGSVEDFSNVPISQVPFRTAIGVFSDSGMRLAEIGNTGKFNIVIDTSIVIPSGSVTFGEIMSLSEGASDIVIGNLLTDTMSFSVNVAFKDNAGSSVPSYNKYGAAFVLNINTDDSQTLTANPLKYQITSLVPAPIQRLIDELTFRTGGIMTNVRVKISDNATGKVIRYIPSQAAFEGVLPGLTLAAGDNKFFFAATGVDTLNTFFLGFTPFIFTAGQLIDFEVVADTMDILGNAAGIPYTVIEAHDGVPTDLLIATTSLIEGSVLFVNGDGTIAQDNANFFWDNTLKSLGIGTDTPAHRLDMRGGDGTLSIRSLSDGVSKILLGDENGVAKLEITYDDSSGTTTISAVDSNLIINSTIGSTELNSELFLQIDRIGTGDSDVDAIIRRINTAATNGVSIDDFQGDRDPNDSITGTGGDVYSRADGVESGTYESLEAATGTEWFKRSINPSNIIEIHNSAEFEALASGGIITITKDTAIIFKTAITTSSIFDVTNAELVLIGINHNDTLVYTGTNTFFTFVDGAVVVDNLIVVATNPLATLVNGVGIGLNFGRFELKNTATVIGWKLGSLSRDITSPGQGGGPSLLLNNCNILDWQDSITLADCFCFTNAVNIFQPAGVSANAPVFIFDNQIRKNAIYRLSTFTGALLPGETLVRVNPGLTTLSEPPQVLIDASNFADIVDAILFDTTGLAPTDFISVANNSITTTVTSVVDSSGVARFTHGGTSPFVGSRVVLTGFGEATYNVTGIISFSNATSFEIANIAFVATDSGTSTMTGVTITSGSHGQSNGTGVVIDTDDATDYDSGFIIYNVTGNTFDIAAIFTITHTGTWSTKGLDQTDSRILATANIGHANSRNIAAAFVNANSTVNGVIVNNTFTDIVFGTAGSALIPGSTIERWKLIDEINGTFEYTGNEPFDGRISVDFTTLSTGGSVEFRYKIVHDIGAGFVDLPDPVELATDIGSDQKSATKTFPLRAAKGDRIKPVITRSTGVSSVTTTYATIYATE